MLERHSYLISNSKTCKTSVRMGECHKVPKYSDMIFERSVAPFNKAKLVTEAQPRDTNNRGVLFPLATVGHKHILMARSIAEGPNFY